MDSVTDQAVENNSFLGLGGNIGVGGQSEIAPGGGSSIR